MSIHANLSVLYFVNSSFRSNSNFTNIKIN